MARRKTERGTYGGERRWSEGAGVSWAAHKTGPQHTSDTRQDEGEPVLWQSPEHPGSGDKGILRQLSDELGITNPSATERPTDEQPPEDDRESPSREKHDVSSPE